MLGTHNTEGAHLALTRWARQHGEPGFAQFAVADTTFRGTPAPIDFSSTPRARRFRSRLRDAEQGPNFAGHYSLIWWPCGVDCSSFAIVDARTGRVWMFDGYFSWPPIFRRDSRLLIDDETGVRIDTGGHPAPRYDFIRYYEWTGRRLVLRDSIDAATACLPLR
jgi:hypothetical protein